MELRKEILIKIFAGISVIAICLAIFFYLNKEEYLFWLSVFANVIQVVLFLLWFFEGSSLPIKKIEEIHKQVTKEKIEDTKKMNIMTQLMKEGLIPGEEIKKAFKSLKLEELIIINPYGEGLSQNLLKEFGLEKQPLITIIRELGFVKVFRYSHIYVIFKKSLPNKLRYLKNLEEYLLSELEKKWEAIKTFTTKKYPENKYKIHAKIRDGTSFRCSYLLLKSLREECIIDFKNNHSFTQEFVKKVLEKYQTKDKVLSPVEVKDFILKIKLSILFSNLDKIRLRKINKKEKDIRIDLKIRNFYEIKDLGIEKISDVISKKTGLKESKEEAELIKNEAEEYYKVLKEMNLI